MIDIVLVGASGWLGRCVSERLPGVIVVSAQAVLAGGGDVVRSLLEGHDRVVINVAGSRMGSRDTMQRLNVDLPVILAEEIVQFGGHLVQLGSAAEYGTAQPDGLCLEEAVAKPESDYGQTKLAGTQRVLDLGCATVLRVFNVAACPPQEGSPLADVVERVSSAKASGADVRLLSAGTVRDWVSREYVCESIEHAALHRPIGLFNVCSGTGIRLGEAVQLAMALLRCPVGVEDMEVFSPTVVIGRPDRWRDVSRLSQRFGPSDLARIIGASASGVSSCNADEEGKVSGSLGA